MIKVNQTNFLERKRVNKAYVSVRKKTYISQEILVFAQSLLVHVQLAAQVGDVLFVNLFVGS